ncbi:hypothetical protein [Pseudomonas phage PaBSM-2607-JFK]|nr:hypothetical protein [Pseudomonas phage PaBSM-2607-JFK]
MKKISGNARFNVVLLMIFSLIFSRQERGFYGEWSR